MSLITLMYSTGSQHSICVFIISDSGKCNTKLICFLFSHIEQTKVDLSLTKPGNWFRIKMLSHQYRKSHCGDKMIQGVWKSSAPSAARWSPNFEMNEWMKEIFWASCLALKPKNFFRRPETIIRSSYLHNRTSDTGKMTSLYRIIPLKM